jgi:hypothetical protein
MKMDDPIPAGFITLPEALQRIAVHVSESHLEIAKAELQELAQSIAAIRQSKESADRASSKPPDSEAAGAATWGRSEEAWRDWNTVTDSVSKPIMERVATPWNPLSGAWFPAAQTRISFNGPLLLPALTSNSPASVKSNVTSSAAWLNSVPWSRRYFFALALPRCDT